ncbi:hypothetical protein [Mesorhizobium sp. WSM2239]|uniref:BA14K family protein n=2 Tax=unclassified Mesorhizobium TaxID=325217 RepID=A0AAU8D2U0_9HYPH
MFGLNWISAAAGAALAAAVTFGAMTAWTQMVTVPAERADAAAEKRTQQARGGGHSYSRNRTPSPPLETWP